MSFAVVGVTVFVPRSPMPNGFAGIGSPTVPIV